MPSSARDDPLRPPPPRERRLEEAAGRPHDAVVVGGGITGAGIALDLALRGLDVVLLERGDWGSETSSASSRLVHGGLRYLEHREIGLVRESCLERALLLSNAAGLVWPERFVFPARRGDRLGPFALAAGLALYTLVSLPRALGVPRMLGRRATARSVRGIDERGLRGAGVYTDAATDDARLTLAVVRTAIGAGAVCVPRAEATAIERGRSGVRVAVRDVLEGGELEVEARAAVLAGGPFADELRARAGLGGRWIAPTRGSHVVVPRERLPTDGAVIFPSPVDGRVVFLIPWPRHTAIGTTDVDVAPPDASEAGGAGDAGGVRATRAEVRYLLDSANGLAPAAALAEEDVVSTWAGLRPLLVPPEGAGGAGAPPPSARPRSERILREGPVWTIAGGKLTTYRAMAESVAAEVALFLDAPLRGRRSPTRAHRLWSALPERAPRPAWSRLDAAGRPDLGREPILAAWGKRYAALVEVVSDACLRAPEGMRALDPDTLLGELDWSVRHEDCLAPADFLFRRTDVGLGPADTAEEALLLVAERMADLLGWSEARRDALAGEAREDLARRSRWRGDPVAGG